MKTLRERLTKTYEVPVYQAIAVGLGMVLFIGVALFGTFFYVDASRDASRRDAAIAVAAAEQASYENARDERNRCEQSVESRDLVRGVLLGLTVRLGAKPETVEIVSAYLDEEYAAKSLDDCPPIPIPPGGSS